MQKCLSGQLQNIWEFVGTCDRLANAFSVLVAITSSSRGRLTSSGIIENRCSSSMIEPKYVLCCS